MGLLRWINQILTVNKINYFFKELLYLPNFCFIIVVCRLSTLAELCLFGSLCTASSLLTCAGSKLFVCDLLWVVCVANLFALDFH